MPTIGEIKKAHELGRQVSKNDRHKLIWHACEGCGKERWVSLVGGKPKSIRCRACHLKLSQQKDVDCARCGQHFIKKSGYAKYCPDCREHLGTANWGSKMHCRDCGKSIRYSKSGYCLQCRYNHPEYNPGWKGGKTRDRKGHVLLKVTRRTQGYKGYISEHRLIWEQTHGNLPPGYIIHHLNGIPDDNRLENLCALSLKNHNAILKVYQVRIKQLETTIRELKTQLSFL